MWEKRIVGLVVLLLTLGSNPVTARADDLQPFTGRYDLISGSTVVGEIVLSLSLRADGSYVYRSESRPTGLVGLLAGGRIEEASHGTLNSRSLRPLHYDYQREGRKARVVALDFDWEKRRVTNIINKDPWTMAIKPDTVDKLAVQLALMRDLQAGKTEFAYYVADGGTLKTYRFLRIGKQTVDTPIGKLESVRVRRDRGRKDRYTDLWCAPHLGFLPVRIVQYRDGEEHARMSLQSFDTKAISR